MTLQSTMCVLPALPPTDTKLQLICGMMIWQWKEKARAAESETQRLQSVVGHLEHAARAQEQTLEQLKGRLTDKVTKEERLARRDADAYARLKRAFLTNKGMFRFCKHSRQAC